MSKGPGAPLPAQFPVEAGLGQVDISVVRYLEPRDLTTLVRPPSAPSPQGAGQGTLRSLRAAHHNAARMLAMGQSVEQVALMTGYSTSRIYTLKSSDPSFQALIEHYGAERSLELGEINELMLALGRTTLEELIEAMELTPEKFTLQQKMDLFELMAVKGRGAPGSKQGAGAPAGPAAAVAINVKFVSPGAPGAGVTIEGAPIDE